MIGSFVIKGHTGFALPKGEYGALSFRAGRTGANAMNPTPRTRNIIPVNQFLQPDATERPMPWLLRAAPAAPDEDRRGWKCKMETGSKLL